MVLSKSTKVFDHSLVLDSGNGMLNFDPSGRNDFVFGFLFCGEFLSPRLLCGLNDGCVARFIALITGVLPGTVAPTNKTSPVKVVITAFLTVCFFFFPL